MSLTFPRVIDATIRNSFVACPTQAYWNHFRHLRKIGGNVHLVFGGTLAKGLETFRKSFYDRRSPAFHNHEASLIAATKAMIHEWGTFEPTGDTPKTFDTCLLALMQYFEQYPPLDDQVQPFISETGPAVEFTFALPIPGLFHPETGEPLLYAGRFDMLGQVGKSLLVVDEKTSGSLGASWAKSWELASQMTGYCWAAREYGHPVAGAIIRGVGILKTRITFLPVTLQRPNWLIDRWLEQLKRDVTRMIGAWQEGFWDQNFGATCGSYGGCAYLELCTVKEPEKWIEGYYEEVVWDPLHKD